MEMMMSAFSNSSRCPNSQEFDLHLICLKICFSHKRLIQNIEPKCLQNSTPSVLSVQIGKILILIFKSLIDESSLVLKYFLGTIASTFKEC
jgi:hypothetical protein